MGMMSRGGRGRRFDEINVTPFVDVTLVLLIIFMVTAPMMVQGVDVDLPRQDTPALQTDSEDQLILSIDADGRTYINEREMTWEELPTKLAAIHTANPDQAVFVKADGSLPYERVIQLMGIAKQSGIGKVGLVTQPSLKE